MGALNSPSLIAPSRTMIGRTQRGNLKNFTTPSKRKRSQKSTAISCGLKASNVDNNLEGFFRDLVIVRVTESSHMNGLRNTLRFCAKDRRVHLGLPYSIIGLFIGFAGRVFRWRVRIAGPAIEFYDGGIKWFVHRLPHGQFTLALTLGHVILGQTDAALGCLAKARGCACRAI